MRRQGLSPTLDRSVLVLNQDYQAISVISPQRAFLLVFLQKAEQLHDYRDRALRSVGREFTYPSVIRLFRYVNLPFRRVALTRGNVFRRDGYRCVYCGTPHNLTIDHVVPRSKGGKDMWDNLATACQTCNAQKGDRTPEEAEMGMRHRPFRPSFIMYLRDYTGRIHDEWKPYLMLN